MPAGPGPAAPVPPGPGPAPMPAAGSAMTDNVASTLCYVLGFITGIIFLLLEPYNRNRMVRFHAFQSIFLNVAIIVLDIGLVIVFAILGSLGGFFIGLLFWPIFGLAVFVLWIYMLISTYQGKTVVLPIIGSLAQSQAG